uniref:Pre-mRNA splicing Prp18-interacting factor n=1 Tax=Tanacetum cinerariifolium TaxID=118510 RepID=A0A6L2P163_TANCI|nr:hypothetical protein [Tanacetum cinerariifolium]
MIKECSSCGVLYTTNYCCSEGSLVDKIICDLNKTPDLFQEPPQNCPKCGNPVDGQYCQGCALLRKELKEVWFTMCEENGILQGLLDTSKPYNDNTNVVNAPQEPFVVKQDLEERAANINTRPFQYSVVHQPPQEEISVEFLQEKRKQINSVQTILRKFNRISFYEMPKDCTIAIIPILSTMEPEDSLRMRDEHLDTIPEKESDEFIKSSVENLILNQSESEDLSDSECDVPTCDDFTTFSNFLFDADYDFSSSDDDSFFDEDISKKIYLNPLFNEEIISIKIDPRHFNAESDLIESLLNRDSLIILSFWKIDSLLDEFAGELILIKSIPPGIDKADCDPEEEIRLIEKSFYDNSSPRPLEEFNSESSDAIIESFSPSPIPVEDSDPFMVEIDLFLVSDGSIPSGIESDYSDSEGDNLFLERLLHDDPIPLPDTLDFSNVI